MDQDARSAKAEAQAAKAKAKALRPWYLKKRFWLLGAIVVVIVIAAMSSGGEDSSTETAINSESESGISSGLGTKDAVADIQNLDCGAPDVIGVTYPKVSVKNNSSKPSDYIITVVAESADGSIKYDSTLVIISELQPGQAMTESGIFTNDLPSDAICKVTEVQRTAS